VHPSTGEICMEMVWTEYHVEASRMAVLESSCAFGVKARLYTSDPDLLMMYREWTADGMVAVVGEPSGGGGV
jgi:hypothetical protein